MSIRCDLEDITLVIPGKLKLTSSWTSNQQQGEFARFEVRLPSEGAFRFDVSGEKLTVVKATRRKVNIGTSVEITTNYVSEPPSQGKRMARFTFVGIAKDATGSDVEVQRQKVKFLP